MFAPSYLGTRRDTRDDCPTRSLLRSIKRATSGTLRLLGNCLMYWNIWQSDRPGFQMEEIAVPGKAWSLLTNDFGRYGIPD